MIRLRLAGDALDPDREGARKRLDDCRARAALLGIAAFAAADAPLLFAVAGGVVQMYPDLATFELALDQLEAAAQPATQRPGLAWESNNARD